MRSPSRTHKIKRKELQALGVALIVSGVYLLLIGSGQIAVALDNIQLFSWLEVFAGSILTWIGAASIAESKIIITPGTSLSTEVSPDQSDKPESENWKPANLNSCENQAKRD